MSWRDRDWARLNEAEQRALFGSAFRATPSTAIRLIGFGVLAAAAIGVFAFLYTTRAQRARFVYADGIAADQQQAHGIACTAEAANTRVAHWVCTQWTVLQHGQTVRPAADPGGPCGVRHVDQAAGAWVCDQVDPPDPDSLPNPRQPVRQVSS